MQHTAGQYRSVATAMQSFLAADEQVNSKWPVAILAGLVLLAVALVAAVVAANPGIFQTEFKAQFLLVSALQLTSGACCMFMLDIFPWLWLITRAHCLCWRDDYPSPSILQTVFHDCKAVMGKCCLLSSSLPFAALLHLLSMCLERVTHRHIHGKQPFIDKAHKLQLPSPTWQVCKGDHSLPSIFCTARTRELWPSSVFQVYLSASSHDCNSSIRARQRWRGAGW